MLPENIAFVDIETTGCSLRHDRIIEIGVVKISKGRKIKEFSTLLNPQRYLPQEITRLTGIRSEELENAPTFRQIKDELQELLRDSVFVAHNVRFDYGFLRHEFKKENMSFISRHFCTVKLSKYLYPRHRRHNLDSIIERFGFSCERRHRAFDDANVLFSFYSHVQKSFAPDILEAAVNKALKKPSAPLLLSQGSLTVLPESPGVYIFYGKTGAPLYVGKSINIKYRVLSHFSNDYATSKEMNIAQQVASIETIETAGELGALFKEADLIKKMQPLYNRLLRHARKLTVVKQKKTHQYNAAVLEEVSLLTANDLDKILGIFPSKKQAKQFLIRLAKEHMLCEKLLGLENTGKACFAYRLGRCHGACVKEEVSLRYNMRFIQAFSSKKIKRWPFASAILIEEKNPLSEKHEMHVFDKWCYMGTITKENELYTLKNDVFFDVSIYKILLSYLKNIRNHKNIRLVSKEKLSPGDAYAYI